MVKTFRDALLEAIDRAGISLKSVADASGVSYEQLKKLRQGKSQSTNVDDAVRIANVLGAKLSDIIGQPGFSAAVAVAGRVGAGAMVPLVDTFEKGDGLYHVARPSLLPASGVVAVQVEGDSMTPMYQPGHVLFFTRNTHEGVLDEDIGKPCIVEDENGMAWVKLVKRGSAPGLWNLVSLNPSAESAWDVKIKWAARVLLALPAELVERTG